MHFKMPQYLQRTNRKMKRCALKKLSKFKVKSVQKIDFSQLLIKLRLDSDSKNRRVANLKKRVKTWSEMIKNWQKIDMNGQKGTKVVQKGQKMIQKSNENE